MTSTPDLLAQDLLALDWGTTRARAYRIDPAGRILARREADLGIQAVPPGGFPEAFAALAGDRLGAGAGAPVLLVGMVGARGGWVEAPYVELPAGEAEIAAALVPVDLGDGGRGWIVPGLRGLAPSGAPDVMRGEETLALGLPRADGLACCAGTHPKWIERRGGRVLRFASFMTGELRAVLLKHSILGRLAAGEEDRAGFALGLAAASRPGGLTHALFEARTGVLAERFGGGAVEPFLEGLLVGAEVLGAQALFGDLGRVALVTAAGRAGEYAEALRGVGADVEEVAPEGAFVAGALRVARAAGLLAAGAPATGESRPRAGSKRTRGPALRSG